MREELVKLQQQQGASFDEASVPVTFGNDDRAIAAVTTGVALCDRAHWGRIQLSGADCKTFLHNQTTNDCNRLKPGDGCLTLFVTSTARTIDLATAYILPESVLVVVSPQRREFLMQWCDRYIFFGDKVKLDDVSDRTTLFSLAGPESGALLQKLGVEVSVAAPINTHWASAIAGAEVRVAVGSGLATEGYSLIVATEATAAVWAALTEAGACPLGDRAWEQLRIQQGRPMPDQELTDDYNAVEASLWQAISLDKGCYIGQETIARLDTYKGVKQQLWGVRSATAIAPGMPITLADEKVGVVTSVVQVADGYCGLGYIKTKAGGAGLTVRIGASEATVVEVPFLQRERLSAPAIAP